VNFHAKFNEASCCPLGIKMKINPGSSVGERRRGQLIYISLKNKIKTKQKKKKKESIL
jgi:hypothetical protein